MVPSPFAMMRLHPKKSIFFMTTANAALWFTYDYTITTDLHRRACKKAALLGDEKLRHFGDQPRHVTVILNPAAGKRKSKKLYTRWVEPLLHLAGIKVSLVETETPKEAHDLMKIMANCDGVAIVGGDGTVHGALNGLLHRPDAVEAAHDFPIGIMPTGSNNIIARLIYQGLQYRNQKELLVQATLKLISQTTKKYDVLKIAPLNSKEETIESQTTPATTSITSYPLYESYIKPYWVRLQKVFKKNLTLPQVEAIAYTDTCIGCSKCINRQKPEPSRNRRWWSMLVPTAKAKTSELSKRDNPTCDKWKRADYLVGDKTIRIFNGDGDGDGDGGGDGGGDGDGDGEYNPSEVLEVQDVKSKLAYLVKPPLPVEGTH